jgi:hypothetical protein
LDSSRSVKSVPLGIGVPPADEELISRLSGSLKGTWLSFWIFVRKGNFKSENETWLSDDQGRLGDVLNRFDHQEVMPISSALPLLIA